MHKIAFAGFRHIHIFDLYRRVLDHPSLELTALCEENAGLSLLPEKGLQPTHTRFEALLADGNFDTVALGDCYGNRGRQAIAALRAGKHVIADKPLCTSLDELSEIADLTRATGLRVGLMLDLRDHGNWIALRAVALSGRIGEIQTVSFGAQHPLLRGKRPSWYFEPGLHGGTINDIAIHAVDFIPWLTGMTITGVHAARTWNAKAADVPHFHDCGQLMLTLSNGGGVLGDVSYLAPDACGYATEAYWRVTLHGTSGTAETSHNAKGVLVADDSSPAPELVPGAPPRPGGYLEDFLSDVAGNPRAEGVTTASHLEASRLALEIERLAGTPRPPSPIL